MDKSLWTASCFLIVAGILFLIGGIEYGTNFENVIDERYIGMVDSRARSSETIKMI